jgi:hypothetical protein
MTSAVNLLNSHQFATMQAMRQDMAMPSFDDEDVAAFCATPNFSNTTSHGAGGYSLTRATSPALFSDSAESDKWIPSCPSYLLHGSDMPEEMLARLDEDPMPLLPMSLMDLSKGAF